jgi:hypothetical protein
VSSAAKKELLGSLIAYSASSHARQSKKYTHTQNTHAQIRNKKKNKNKQTTKKRKMKKNKPYTIFRHNNINNKTFFLFFFVWFFGSQKKYISETCDENNIANLMADEG